MKPTRVWLSGGTLRARVTFSNEANHAISMSTLLLITAFACLAVGIRISRAKIPTEDAVPLDLNRRRGMGLAAALNLSRAVRRIR